MELTLLTDIGKLPPITWAAAFFVGFMLFLKASRFMSGLWSVEVHGSISRVCRSGVIQLDVGESDKVAVGQIFTVYKKLSLREVWQECGRNSLTFTPVGQVKVISTTRQTSLCKFRPIKGYSYNPSLGDTAYYSSRVPLGKVIPLPTA